MRSSKSLSLDSGATWKHVSTVSDRVNGWGMRYQPFLYELPQSLGDLPEGTILCAGNAIPYRKEGFWLVHAMPAASFAGRSANSMTPITTNTITSVKFLWTLCIQTSTV